MVDAQLRSAAGPGSVSGGSDGASGNAHGQKGSVPQRGRTVGPVWLIWVLVVGLLITDAVLCAKLPVAGPYAGKPSEQLIVPLFTLAAAVSLVIERIMEALFALWDWAVVSEHCPEGDPGEAGSWMAVEHFHALAALKAASSDAGPGCSIDRLQELTAAETRLTAVVGMVNEQLCSPQRVAIKNVMAICFGSALGVLVGLLAHISLLPHIGGTDNPLVNVLVFGLLVGAGSKTAHEVLNMAGSAVTALAAFAADRAKTESATSQDARLASQLAAMEFQTKLAEAQKRKMEAEAQAGNASDGGLAAQVAIAELEAKLAEAQKRKHDAEKVLGSR